MKTKYLCTREEPVNDGDPIFETYTFERGVTVMCALERLMEQGIPLKGTQCQHSHDCCGNWYAQQATHTVTTDGRVVVTQAWYQNI